jgi:hypothetical protein
MFARKRPELNRDKTIPGFTDNTPSGDRERIYPTSGKSFAATGKLEVVSRATRRPCSPKAKIISVTEPPIDRIRLRSASPTAVCATSTPAQATSMPKPRNSDRNTRRAVPTPPIMRPLVVSKTAADRRLLAKPDGYRGILWTDRISGKSIHHRHQTPRQTLPFPAGSVC